MLGSAIAWPDAPSLRCGGRPPVATAVSRLQAQSVEEAKRRRDHLAKMRSLLFHQETKLKHLAKIKSKDYHRRAQKAARAKVRLLRRCTMHWAKLSATQLFHEDCQQLPS